jgi:hypothetical protein
LQAPAPKIRETSFVHGLFGVTPGHAPGWVYACCCGGCEGAVIMFVPAGALAAGVVAGRLYGWWWLLVLLLPPAVLWFAGMAQFGGREHSGRARLRRGECVWCGRADTAPGTVCATCGRNT